MTLTLFKAGSVSGKQTLFSHNDLSTLGETGWGRFLSGKLEHPDTISREILLLLKKEEKEKNVTHKFSNDPDSPH